MPRSPHVLLCVALTCLIALPASAREAPYEACPAPSRDGIGKCYMGREIAQVMGHQGAEWLERPEREQEERPSVLIRNLPLRPGANVADIGAATGYFAFRIAALVPQGKVYAVDIQPEMLQIMERRKRENGVRNVQPVLGTIDDPRLPADSVDLVLMVDVYHEFSQPREMMQAVARALRAGGRVALVEYRAEDPDVPIKMLHKMTQAQAIREMAAAGLRHVETRDVLPWQHLMFFEKQP
jgi:ubiquinone/menaquinone biosynthesis C-methylase UbiE